jgi:hypothetical protein
METFTIRRPLRRLILVNASLGFGIVFSTSIILVLVPALYLILEDIKGVFRGARH